VLGLDGVKRTTRDQLALSYAIGGAQLAELVLAQRITVDAEQVLAVDQTATGDADLDGLLAKIAGGDRARTPAHWVMKRRSAGVAVYARRLVAMRVLRGESSRWLGLVPRTVFPVVDGATRERLLAQIRAALADPAAPAPHDAALIALLYATGDAARLMGDHEQQARAQRIASEDVIASTVKRAVDTVHAGAAGASPETGAG